MSIRGFLMGAGNMANIVFRCCRASMVIRKKFMKSTLFFIITLLLFFPGRILAFNSGNCHCFRHRSYDVHNKFAADDYLLATGYNSLLARVFHIAKRTIIMKKMQGGINGDDLVIGLYIREKTGKPLNLLLSVRDNGGSWQQILAAAWKKTTDMDTVLHAVADGVNGENLAGIITGYMLENRYNCSPATLEKLRNAGFTDRESNLLLALSEQTGARLDQLQKMVRIQKMSWAEIGHHFGLTPAAVGKKILSGNPAQLR